MLYSLEQSIGASRTWDKAFLTTLGGMFKGANFTTVQIKLPRNLIPAKENDLISLETFLARERNYPAVILIASNTKASETIKVLFVNISKQTFFVDDTFPSGHSQPTAIYVQSLDPARTYGLHAYFHHYIKSRSKPIPSFRSALIFAALLIAEVLGFGSGSTPLVSIFQNDRLIVLDLLLIFVSFVTLYAFFASPRGLHIRLRESSFGKMFMMAVRGEFRDNPFVSLVFTILGTVIGAIILRLLGFI